MYPRDRHPSRLHLCDPGYQRGLFPFAPRTSANLPRAMAGLRTHSLPLCLDSAL